MNCALICHLIMSNIFLGKNEHTINGTLINICFYSKSSMTYLARFNIQEPLERPIIAV